LMSPRPLTVSDLLNATDSFMWLERVTDYSKGMDINDSSHNLTHISHNTVLNLCDLCMYAVAYESDDEGGEEYPTLRRTSGPILPPVRNCIYYCIRVGSCLYLKREDATDLHTDATTDPSSWDVYHMHTGVFTQCNPTTGPPRCEETSYGSLSPSPASDKILHYSADGLWLFDTESETWQRVSGSPPDDSGQHHFSLTTNTVGDSTVFVDFSAFDDERLRVTSFSETRGWETLVPLNVHHYFCTGVNASLGNNQTICVSEGGVSVVDLITNEIRQLVDVDFDCVGVQIGPGLCLVQCRPPVYRTDDNEADDEGHDEESSASMDTGGHADEWDAWYLLHLDLSMLQQTGGQLTADMLLGDLH
ncbi:hypothetical protein KIPB_005232, partial [Kipferlia bialata]